jgi:hypothetical protein
MADVLLDKEGSLEPLVAEGLESEKTFGRPRHVFRRIEQSMIA